MKKQELFPDAISCRSIDEGFDPFMEWLDAHPDQDVTNFTGWREAACDPSPPDE